MYSPSYTFFLICCNWLCKRVLGYISLYNRHTIGIHHLLIFPTSQLPNYLSSPDDTYFLLLFRNKNISSGICFAEPFSAIGSIALPLLCLYLLCLIFLSLITSYFFPVQSRNNSGSGIVIFTTPGK